MPRPPLDAKIVALPTLLERIRARREDNARLVFTNGCFDLLHRGHVELLEASRDLGDLLVVGLNSDRSVRRLKGPGRPVLGERERAVLLAGLRSVDYVVVFEEETPLRLIEAILPDVLVKGADWGPAAIVGRQAVERAGGRVVVVPLVAGVSTTDILARVRELLAEEVEDPDRPADPGAP